MNIAQLSKTAWTLGKKQALNLFLANPCPVCDRPSPTTVCDSCQRQLRRHQLPQPLAQNLAGLTVLSWGTYEGSLKQSIATLKYSGQTELSQFLGFELGQTWLQQIPARARSSASPVVIPIPLHPDRQQQRGFNQAELLAQWFCHVTHLPLVNDGLFRVQKTLPQHSLSRVERHQNLDQAFAINEKRIHRLQRSPVWLFDDIFTTGATAQSAANTLRRYKISVTGICTVARTIFSEPHHS
jgi:ComF family protein